ncbi:capsid protein [Pacific flying fox faeces associated gemycircularvirus-2]|uniref:Capsid protein n=1 Tax=Pacific flying fox faeces associated gemycircularvirus-2 TaxID=1795994 RepID=A0A140CTL1_9VIRU|nr:capsid protein [Pacific flying fox faeces associated gemycircularvirus-2]
MAYPRRSYRRASGRRRVSRRAPRRTKRTYRRTYRRRRVGGRGGRRSLLNATSRKKRNTMLQFVNTNSTSGLPVTPGPGPYVVAGNQGSAFSVFTATAMDLYANGNANTIANQAQRTSTTCYVLGYAEKIRIQTSSGLPWFWRRIVVRVRDPLFVTYATNDTPTYSANMSYVDTTTNGMQRAYINQTINAANNTITGVQGVLFRGTVGRDWTDIQTAIVDTTRVDLVSDTRMTIRSGNANGTVKDVNMWHPYRRNLVYDDDELGEQETANYVSTESKQGGGDMHVIDIFTPGTGAGASDLLQLTSTSTLYWHEK